MHQKKKLTQAERDAIAAKYRRRIIELGIPIFGPPDEEDELGPNVVPFPDPYAEEREIARELGRAKSQEFERRMIEASIQLLEAVPPDYAGTAPHRKPGDLERTAERLREEKVDLPVGFDREEEAASFDKHAAFERAKIEFGQQMDAVAFEALSGFIPLLEAVTKFAIDVYHEVKRWVEEDPEGPAAEYFPALQRAWRQGAGRSRGRKDGANAVS